MAIVTNSSNLIAEGTYHLRVHNATYIEKPIGVNAKPYIKVQFVIQGPDGLYLGRMIFANYPVDGPAEFRIKELLTATLHPEGFELESADQLIGLEFNGMVMIEKGENGWPDKNIVKRHMKLF